MLLLLLSRNYPFLLPEKSKTMIQISYTDRVKIPPPKPGLPAYKALLRHPLILQTACEVGNGKCYYPHFTGGDSEAGRLCDLPQATQQIHARPRITIQQHLTSGQMLKPWFLLPLEDVFTCAHAYLQQVCWWALISNHSTALCSTRVYTHTKKAQIWAQAKTCQCEEFSSGV